jgi:hypothetical protein
MSFKIRMVRTTVQAYNIINATLCTLLSHRSPLWNTKEIWFTDNAAICIIHNGPRKSNLPSVLHCKSLCYIGYTSTWLDVRSCVLMQEATTFNIFYDGISFQHLATVLISRFKLCYGPGLFFRGPSCILLSLLYCKHVGIIFNRIFVIFKVTLRPHIITPTLCGIINTH